MALFKCQGDVVVKNDINLSLTTDWKNWNSTQFESSILTFDNPITPTQVELMAKVEIYNGGSGINTWAETNTYFYLKDTNGNWQSINRLRTGADFYTQTSTKTQSFDISSLTNGKKYVAMKIEVGKGSSDCTARRSGRATIKEYKM